VNPREPTTQSYDEAAFDRYSKDRRRSTQEPHLFWTCNSAYRLALEKQRSHVMIFKGESGSGKTEQFKQALAFFTKIGGRKEALNLKINRVWVLIEYRSKEP